MTQIAQGSLTMIGLNTPTPQVFWNGKLVEGIVSIRTDWESDEQRVTLKVNGTDDATYIALATAGVRIRKDNHHV
jgi:hypothetical protein